MLSFTMPNGDTTSAPDLRAFIDNVIPPGVSVDLLWTGHGTGDAPTALLLMPREPDHAFVAVTRIDGAGMHIGAREARAIAQGRLDDPFGGNRTRIEQLKDQLQERLSGAAPAPYHTSRGPHMPRLAPSQEALREAIEAQMPRHSRPQRAAHQSSRQL